MCNVWQMDHSNEMDLEEFSGFMNDPLFKEVFAVGINGGEPTLKKDLYRYAEEILSLPSLKSLNIISNGFNKTILLQQTQKIYQACRERGITFHIAISLDGYGKTHDKVRGIKHAFEKSLDTIKTIHDNPLVYCDSYDIGCTVIHQNVDELMELDTFIKMHGYNIKYRLGIKNKRIESDRLMGNFSVLMTDESQSAAEFFHYKMATAERFEEKFKYFAIYYWLAHEHKRLLGCDWQHNGVTLDSRGELYYCAVESNTLGSLRSKNGEDVFFDKKNLEYRESIIENRCDECIHDYNGPAKQESLELFGKYLLEQEHAMDIYRQKAELL
jgi:sulfatase maturation enzyme AslB (radical SAM superfamily)